MVRKILLASSFCAAMFAGIGPASARWVTVLQEGDCAFCAPRYVVVEANGELASRSYRGRNRGELWAMYPDRPYTRFDVEGIRVLERMR